MSERATVFQTVQIGMETTPGEAVPAGKRLLATAIEPSINAEITPIRPFGGKFNTGAVLGKDYVTARVSGQMTYNDLAYLLASLLSYEAPTGAGDAKTWLFEVLHGEADTSATFTVEVGDSDSAGAFSYGLMTSLTLTIDRSRAEFSGEMVGQAYDENAAMTANPTDVPIVPLLPKQVTVYLDDAAADLGDTPLERALSVELAIADRFATVWALDASVDGYVAHVEKAPSATIKLLVEADTTGIGLLSVARAGTKKFIRIEALGEDIVTGTPYELTIDACGVITQVGQFSDQDGVYAIEYTFAVAFDGTWDAALKAKLVNTLTDL